MMENHGKGEDSIEWVVQPQHHHHYYYSLDKNWHLFLIYCWKCSGYLLKPAE
jgi:hypothetical protein